MSEKKKNAATEEVKEEARKLSEEELEKVNGGIKGAVPFRIPVIKEAVCIGYIAHAMHVETGE